MSGRAVTVSGISLSTALLLAFTGTTAGAAQHAPRTERVSTAADGTQGDGASSAAVTTPNGRYIAFRSSATNLVPEGVTRPGTYSCIRDLTTGEVTKIEQALSTPRLSADGRWATYTDWGSRNINVFLSDLSTGTRIRVGAPDGRERDLRTGRVRHFPGVRVLAVSPDGQRLLTRDADANLTLRGLRGGREIPVGHGRATAGSVSAHGRSVVYSTEDADVVPDDTNGLYDVFQWRSR
ncbi:hypothetical protein [Streptomyces lacrimifluminis]|nr:hypothetical protein [Streptomyces lacrimifluminis]